RTLAEAVTELDKHIDAATPALKGDMTFAMSLVKQYKERGSLTPKQAYWVHALCDKANDGETGETGIGLAIKTNSVEGFAPLLEWFANAGQRVQWPSCRLEYCRLKGRAGLAKIRVLS